ncbi:protein translocase subunit secG [Chitinophaga rupis]|jgi:preprotein translocase subunit SecG|uniref:Protein-export membrane protein SecG n=1 Tax=Chitinophaga rupis TaxID=573321 RepID=A0A1H7UJ44_9BACT|nr:preprotein translocase subunit SecG [Chitinophaga rupis]SEL97043.1 protein translocase subunit secG [Chitinophaga rupis]
MLLLFGIVIILACVLLGFFVLIQNPKGGGLSGSFGGFGNQVMGVRQTTDVLEKGTWVLAAIIAVLCLTSSFFVDKNAAVQQQSKTIMEQNAGRPVPQPTAPPATLPATPQQQPAPNKK